MTAAVVAAANLRQARKRAKKKRALLAAWTTTAPKHPKGTVTASLKTNGTDQTVALQRLLDTNPRAIFVPAGTYAVKGPVVLRSPVALIGEEGTIIDCSKARKFVFTINKDSPRVAGFSIAGIAFRGTGVVMKYGEPGSVYVAIIDAWDLDEFSITGSKFYDCGYAAVCLTGCEDALIQNCHFDNIFFDGSGYGIAVHERCDRVTIRKNWFTTLGRHNVTIGIHSEFKPYPEMFARAVTIENNYSEKTTSAPYDSHQWYHGPYLIRDNVIVDCQFPLHIRGDEHGATFEDNVCLGCHEGVTIRNQRYSATTPPPMTHIVRRNLIQTKARWGVYLDVGTVRAERNIFLGPRDGSPVFIGTGIRDIDNIIVPEYVPDPKVCDAFYHSSVARRRRRV